MSQAEIDAILVNWNSGATLAGALTSLAAQRGVTVNITVVDNASTDESLDLAKRTQVPFTLLQTGANLGYTGGNNAAFARLALDKPVLVINPDASLVADDCLSELIALLGPSVAAVGPTLLADEDGPIEYVGTSLDLRRAFVGKSEFLAPSSTLRSGAVPVPWLDGAALLFSPEALRHVGGFDDRFFLYFDEVDWCIRATDLGWTLLLARGIPVVHRRSSSFATSKKGTYYYWRNMWLLVVKHVGLTARVAVLARGAVAMLRFLRTGDREKAWLVVVGLRDGLSHRYGPGPMDR